MVDDRRIPRAAAVMLGAVAALMTTPAIGWAETPDADTSSSRRADQRSDSRADRRSDARAERRADTATPVAVGRGVRPHSTAATHRPRSRDVLPSAASAQRVRDLAEPAAAPGPARSGLAARAVTAPSAWEAGLAWFQHTVNNATPTFGDQLHTVSVSPGHSSAPMALGGFDADGDPLSYTVSGAGSGDGGVLAIVDGAAAYTPPDTWDGTTSYDDAFLVTVTDAGGDWHLHGLAGLLNLLTFGMFGSPGDSATGTVTVRVTATPGAGPEPGPDPGPDPDPVPDPDPGPPAPEPTPDPDPPVAQPDPPVVDPDPTPGAPVVAGSFPVSFVNSNGTYADDEIYVMVIGQATPGQWSWVDRNGAAHPIDHTAANAADHLVKNGVSYPNMSFTLAEAGSLRIPPELLGARIYVSLGEPVYIAVSPDNTGWAGPDPANPTDPNYRTVYDWYELSFKNGSVPFGGNTTQVDQFGFPYTFTLTQESTGYTATRGITVSRDELFRRFEDTMPAAFRSLIIDDVNGDPVRILAPRSHQPGELATWFDGPVDDFWTTYAGEQFVYHGPGFTVTGGVDAEDRFAYTVTSAGGDATSHTMTKPSTADVFRADGPFIGTGLQGAFLAHLDAAFHRGVATSPQNWDTASAYYPAGGRWNNWAQFFHANSVEGYAYGFPYDDVNSQSSVLILNNSQPLTGLTLAIGG